MNDACLQEQFDCLPFLCRFQYEDLSKYLCSLADLLVKGLTDCSNLTVGSDASRLVLLEGQLTWIVYIIGAVIRGRLNSSSAESQESIGKILYSLSNPPSPARRSGGIYTKARPRLTDRVREFGI